MSLLNEYLKDCSIKTAERRLLHMHSTAVGQESLDFRHTPVTSRNVCLFDAIGKIHPLRVEKNLELEFTELDTVEYEDLVNVTFMDHDRVIRQVNDQTDK